MRQLTPRTLGLALLAVSLGVLAPSASASATSLRLESITPPRAPEFTSVAVTIHGKGFSTVPGATIVSFGGTAAEDVICKSTSVCTAMTPELPAGPVEVQASVGELTSDTKTFTYETYSPPSVEILSSEDGPTFSKRSITDRYPGIFTPGNVYLDIVNSSTEVEDFSGPTGPVSLEPGSVEGYNVPVTPGTPYVFRLAIFPHRELLLKTKTPR